MKNAILFTILLSLCLGGCGAESGSPQEPVVSTVSTEDCFLCGGGAGETFCWGENNVGIIDLNTFEAMPIQINRYDEHGALLEEGTSCLTCRWFSSNNSAPRAHVFEEANRGYAVGSITFPREAALNREALAMSLCQDCLDATLSNVFETGFNVGMINFSSRELRPFEDCTTGFGLGDYYIDLDWDEPKKTNDLWGADIFVCYCPLRYGRDDPGTRQKEERQKPFLFLHYIRGANRRSTERNRSRGK